jgi:hypothetical protein
MTRSDWLMMGLGVLLIVALQMIGHIL